MSDYQAFLDFFPVTRMEERGYKEDIFGESLLEEVPAFLDKFDLHAGEDWPTRLSFGFGVRSKIGEGGDAKYVLVTGEEIQAVLEYAAKEFDASHNDRVLVVTGTEAAASEAFGTNEQRGDVMKLVKKYFRDVFFEASDLRVDGVRTMPQGLCEHYLRQGRTDSALRAYEAARVDDSFKTGQVLAAWNMFPKGVKEKVAWQPKPDVLVGYFSPAWSANANRALQSRKDADAWASTPQAQAVGVERRKIEDSEWFGELSRYRFMLSPLGTGVQSSKVIEALLVLTVPIVQRGPYPAYDDLVKDYGFPLVVVDQFADVRAEDLDRWWQELSPRLETFRCRCLSTEGYWRLVTTGSCL